MGTFPHRTLEYVTNSLSGTDKGKKKKNNPELLISPKKVELLYL